MSKVQYLISVFLLCFTSMACADETIRVNLEEISFSQEGMLLCRDGEVYLVKKIEELGGRYSATICKGSPWYWTCPKCKFANRTWARSCGNCGYTPIH